MRTSEEARLERERPLDETTETLRTRGVSKLLRALKADCQNLERLCRHDVALAVILEGCVDHLSRAQERTIELLQEEAEVDA